MMMRRHDGFTLLEVLIALAILGIGIIAVMQLFPASLRQSQLAAERTVITGVANSELSRLRAIDLNTKLDTWKERNTFHTLTEIERIYALYEGWSSTVTRVPGARDTYRVTFTIERTDGRTETFVTYVTAQ